MDGWIDCGTYLLNTYKQGEEGWLEARKKCVITASKFYDAYRYIKLNGPVINNGFITPNEAMIFGTKMEPVIRDWFSHTYKLKIKEVGLAIPKWCPQIGSSVDGLIMNGDVVEGMIEIKTTKSHSSKLLNKVGEQRDYISPWHYAQMQGCMAIMDLSYCYYVSYSREQKNIHVVKIYRDKSYWDNDLYPSLLKYIDSVS